MDESKRRDVRSPQTATASSSHELDEANKLWPFKKPEVEKALDSAPNPMIFVYLLPLLALSAGAKTLSAGYYHTVALERDGTVFSWGDNANHQLGNALAPIQYAPVLLPNVDHAVDVDAGYQFTCLVEEAGQVKCVGMDNYRQSSGDTAAGGGDVSTSTLVGGFPATAISVSADVGASCAVLAGGSFVCWGKDRYGVQGRGNRTDRTDPLIIALPGDELVADISVGAWHSCVLTSLGLVKCSGINTYGALGDGTNEDKYIHTPTSALADTASSIALGVGFTCTLLTSNSVQCWGWNKYGQLGIGSTADSNVPISPTLPPISQLNAKGLTVCVIVASDKSVLCFGYNGMGQLGNGDWSGAGSTIPVLFGGGTTGVKELTVGGGHTCIRMMNNNIRCVGANENGQLGKYTADSHTVNLGPPVVGIPASLAPTNMPTRLPTTRRPTKFPTRFPTPFPTKFPTKFPTRFPKKTG